MAKNCTGIRNQKQKQGKTISILENLRTEEKVENIEKQGKKKNILENYVSDIVWC